MKCEHWCDKCEVPVETPKVIIDEEPYESWGNKGMQKVYYYVCPTCGDDLADYEGQDEVTVDE